MRQFSYLIRLLLGLVASASALAASFPTDASGQDRYRVTRDENFRREPRPDGRLLASVRGGSVLAGGERRDGWVEVTLEGWIWSASVRTINSDPYDLEVTANNGENLRASPNGRVVARLDRGFWLAEEARDGQWIKVSRSGWMWGRSLQADQPVASAPPPASATRQPATPAPQRSDPPASLDYAVAGIGSTFRIAPDGDTLWTAASDTPVTVVERDGEWVRVRSEGWVHEDDLRTGDGDVLLGVSGAEVRGRPRDFEGAVLQWTVRFISVREADGLREEIPAGSRYMLASGPIPEAGFLYVLLSDRQAQDLDRVSPLAELVILARVVRGRERFLGYPVLEMLEMTVRRN